MYYLYIFTPQSLAFAFMPSGLDAVPEVFRVFALFSPDLPAKTELRNKERTMQNVLKVHEEKMQPLTIDRHQDTCVSGLDRSINEFIEKLKYIERRSEQAHASMDELLIATTKAIVEMGTACRAFEQSCEFDKVTIKQAQVRFRERTAELFAKSYFMNRARTWPRGYAGDYETLEGVYRNIPKSEGIGFYLDRYFLATTLPGAVRDRKDLLRALLRRQLGRRHAPNVLDVACGSSREVFELAQDIVASRAVFTLVDYDSDALAFSRDRLNYAGISPEQIVYRRYNAFKMTNHGRNVAEFGLQDVIYSVGFFDYVKDDVLIPMLSSLYRLLAPGGALITSFKDSARYEKEEYHWFVDWDGFYQRTEEASYGTLIQAGIPEASITSVRDASGVIIFFTAER